MGNFKFLSQLALAATSLITGASAAVNTSQPLTYGILLFRNFDIIDVSAPVDVFNFLGANYKTNVHFISNTMDPVTTRPFLTAMNPLNNSLYVSVNPTHTYDTVPPLDVLIIPGGTGWRNPNLADLGTLDFIKTQARSVKHILTICTGSALLARTGLLNGRKATANKSSWPATVADNPDVLWQGRARWIEDESANPPVWSSSGVTAGIDLMLEWTERMYNRQNATNIARFIEHVRREDWRDDPFARNDTATE